MALKPTSETDDKQRYWPMKTFEFTITIDQYVEDMDVVDAFYSKADDATIVGSDGQTLIHFDREANSLDDALRRAVGEVQQQGWQVREILVEPTCLSPV